MVPAFLPSQLVPFPLIIAPRSQLLLPGRPRVISFRNPLLFGSRGLAPPCQPCSEVVSMHTQRLLWSQSVLDSDRTEDYIHVRELGENQAGAPLGGQPD